MKLDFSPRQLEVYKDVMESWHRITILGGSIRAGKTFIFYFLMLAAVQYVIEKKLDGQILLVGKTERTIKLNIVDPLIALFGSDNVKFSMGSGELYFFGRLIYCIGAYDKKSEEKIRGSTVILALVDEGTLLPENFFTQLLGRMSPDEAICIMTTNTDGPYHYLKTKFIDKGIDSKMPDDKKIDCKYYGFKLDDNVTLSDAYKRSVRAEYTGVFYQRAILGKWVLAEGLIYSVFEEIIHSYPNNSIPEITKEVLQRKEYENDIGYAERIQPLKQFVPREYWVSCDYGTGTTTVFCLHAKDEKVRTYLVRSWYWDAVEERTQKTNRQFKQVLVEWLTELVNTGIIITADGVNVERFVYSLPIYVDPSATSFIKELYSREDGSNLIDASEALKNFTAVFKADNSIVDGIRFCMSALEKRGAYIHRSNDLWFKEQSMYVWDEKQQEKGIDAPIKKNDHILDAWRYGVYSPYALRKKARARIVGGRR